MPSALRGELCWRQVATATVRSAFVVVLSPVVDDAAHVAQTGKPVLRQAFVAKAAVEAFDVRVLRRFAGLDKTMLDGPLSRPGLHHAALRG